MCSLKQRQTTLKCVKSAVLPRGRKLFKEIITGPTRAHQGPPKGDCRHETGSGELQTKSADRNPSRTNRARHRDRPDPSGDESVRQRILLPDQSEILRRLLPRG